MEIVELDQGKYHDEHEALLAILVELFREELYLPLLDEFGVKNRRVLHNTLDDLISAIMSGQINYYRGKFVGKWDSLTSREMRKLGAVWDRKEAAFRLSQDKMPVSLRHAVLQSEEYFRKKMARVETRLQDLSSKLKIPTLSFEDFFDKTLWKADGKLQKQFAGMTVEAQLTPERAKYLRENYTKNLELGIRGFLDEEVVRLRKKLQDSAFKGLRAEAMIEHIIRSYDVTYDKAKFLAKQETKLLLNTYKESKYQGLGVSYYAWRSVTGTEAHPVRPQHQKLNDLSTKGLAMLATGKYSLEELHKKGLIFRFDDPPVVSEPGQRERRANAGSDFNCLVAGTEVNFRSNIKSAFKRFYTGPVVKITDEADVAITVTPNHPVLTARGWVLAKDINHSDKLFKAFNSQKTKVFNAQIDDNKIPCDQVFDLLNIIFLGEWMSGIDTQFHGDGITNQKVNIIRVNRSLPDNFDSILDQKIKDFIFANPDLTEGFLARATYLFQLISVKFPTFCSEVSFSDLVESFGGGHFRPLQFFRIRLTPNSYAIFQKSASNDISGNTQLLCNLILAQHINGVEFDNTTFVELFIIVGSRFIFHEAPIKSIGFDNYQGDVFNFETESNDYLANDILVHNCRCYHRLLIDKQAQLP